MKLRVAASRRRHRTISSEHLHAFTEHLHNLWEARLIGWVAHEEELKEEKRLAAAASEEEKGVRG